MTLCRVVCDSCADLGYCAAFLDAHYTLDNRLIAAAPDLLEALKAVVHVADRRTVEFDAARAAIAKATGGQS